MQRRAAAIYFVFFLVIGAGAYAFIGVAEDTQRPQHSLDGTTFSNGTTQTIDGTEYTVPDVGHASSGGGGHGGGGEAALVAHIEWTNGSAEFTASFGNESEFVYDNETYYVLIPNESGTNSFALQEGQNVSQILRQDDAVENSLATRNGTDHVVFRENQSIRPLSEYLPEPQREQFSEGDTVPYDGNQTTVANVTSEQVTLQWSGTRTESRELSEGGNVTLAGGNQYFVHFPSEHEVKIVPSDQYGQYNQTVNERQYFTERMNGLWGVVILAFSTAILLLGTAYLPVRG